MSRLQSDFVVCSRNRNSIFYMKGKNNHHPLFNIMTFLTPIVLIKPITKMSLNFVITVKCYGAS